MIYEVHETASNFDASVKFKDTKMMKDVIASEIGALIAYDRKDLLDEMKAEGIVAGGNDSSIINALIRHLPKNKNLRIRIAYLIADRNNIVPEMASNVSGTGSSGTGTGSSAKTDIDSVKSLADSLTTIFGVFQGFKDDKERKQAEEEYRKKLAAAAAVHQGKPVPSHGSNTGWYIFGAVAAIALIGGAIYLGVRKTSAPAATTPPAQV